MSTEERLLAALLHYEYIEPLPPLKRCRVCQEVLDEGYRRKKVGLICLTCWREQNREQARKNYLKDPSKMVEYNKTVPKYIANARAHANFKYPVRQVCSIYGCDRMGVRHHPDYAKPSEIVWLCHIHHYKEHHGW